MDPVLDFFRQHPREGWEWTLDPGIRTWIRGNALALANCSLLAYSDKEKIDEQLGPRGFDPVIPCDHPSSDTQAYVAVRSNAVIVAFRGTEPTRLQDFTTDRKARLVPFETKFRISGWGQVHEGWADGAHAHRTKSVWITGHSLGGALAMVTAAVLAKDHPIAGVYTFGQPRVGDPAFCARYEETLGGITFRCVNDRDLVPHVPPRELTQTERVLATPSVRSIVELGDALVHGAESTDRYEHAGQLRLLLPNGEVSDKLADESAREPDFLARPRSAQTLFGELSGLLIKSPALLKDHFPINPATHDGYVERIEALPLS
jgi:triacylglycerol lipase